MIGAVLHGAATLAHDFGQRVGVVDLDPRSTATTWLGVEAPPGHHFGTILGQDDVDGAASELAVASPWMAGISVLAGSRDVAALEGTPQEYGEIRLRHALAGWDRDVVPVVAKRVRDAADHIVVMLTTGHHQPLTPLEEARGFHLLKDRGCRSSTSAVAPAGPQATSATTSRCCGRPATLRTCCARDD